MIDVLCSYLRRPFFHYAYVRDGPDPDRSDFADPDRGRLSAEETADDRERQVRLTAQRVLLELLPAAGSPGPAYDLDLTGASLEYLRLEGRRIGGLLARRATFYGITRLGAAEFTGRAMLTGAVFRGRVQLTGTRFLRGFSLESARLLGEVDLNDAVFGDFADLRWQTAETVLLDGAVALPGVRLKLPPGVSVPPLIAVLRCAELAGGAAEHAEGPADVRGVRETPADRQAADGAVARLRSPSSAHTSSRRCTQIQSAIEPGSSAIAGEAC